MHSSTLVIGTPDEPVAKARYEASKTGKLTAAGGFDRDGWRESSYITAKEEKIVRCVVEHPHTAKRLTMAQIGEKVGLSTSQVAGSMSVLMAKGYLRTHYVRRPASKGGNVRTVTATNKAMEQMGVPVVRRKTRGGGEAYAA